MYKKDSKTKEKKKFKDRLLPECYGTSNIIIMIFPGGFAAILPSPRRYAGGETTPYLDSRIATIRRHMGYAQIP